MSDGTTTTRSRWEQNVETGKVLLARGDHARAADAFAAAARAAEHEFGSNSLQLGACLTALGHLALQRRDHVGAADSFTRALAIRERALGPDHADVVQSLNGLAAAYVAASDFDRAEPLMRRALEITERLRGLQHPEVGTQLNNLAKLHFKRGEFAQAEPLLTRLLVIKRAAGPAGAEVATVLASLATVKQTVGDHMAAEQLWREAISLRERASSPTDSALAPLLENLSDCCAARQKRADAIELRQRALGIRESALGADHPSVAAARAKLASLRDGTALTPGSLDASSDRQLSPMSVPVALRDDTPPALRDETPPALRDETPSLLRGNSPSAADDTIWWSPNSDSPSKPAPLPARVPTPVDSDRPIDASWEPRAGAASAPPPLEVMSPLPAPQSPFEPASPPSLSDILAPAPPPVQPLSPPVQPLSPPVPPLSAAPPLPLVDATWTPTPPPSTPALPPTPFPAPAAPTLPALLAPAPPRQPPPRREPITERPAELTPEERPQVVPRPRSARRSGGVKRFFLRTVAAAALAGGIYVYSQRPDLLPALPEWPASAEAAPDTLGATITQPPVAPLPDGRPNVPTGPAVAPLPRRSQWHFSRSSSEGSPPPTATIRRVRPINVDGVTRAIDLKTRPGVEAATGITLKPPVFTPAPAPAHTTPAPKK